MKRKFITILILSAFLFSASGLSFTVHYCQMLTEGTDKGKCEFMMRKPEKTEKHRCCSEKNDHKILVKTLTIDNCCLFETIENGLTTNLFLQKIEQKLSKDKVFTLFQTIDINFETNKFNNSLSDKHTLLIPYHSFNIYIHTSTLLI